MSLKIDRQLVAELESNPDFQKMKRTISYDSNRLFRHAWVMYEAKKWYPVLIKDNETDEIGFEFNPSGTRGKKEVVGKIKLSLAELLTIIISHSYIAKATVRSKYDSTTASTNDARYIENMQFDSELSSLINKFKNLNQLSNKSVFSKEDKSLVSQSAEEIESFVQGFEGEEKDIIAKARINQGKFRKLLLNYWGSACAVSGLSDERLLVASHILPWSKSTDNQKGDPFNGLLLSVVWDSLFDKGLVSFDDEGKAILSRLTEEVIDCLSLNKEMCTINSDKLTDYHRRYIQIHRILHLFE